MDEKDVKQVIVFRKDLLKGENSIRKGKFGAMVAHASLGAVLSLFDKTETFSQLTNKKESTVYKLEIPSGTYLDTWLNGIFKKICLSIDNEEELVRLYETIKNENPNIPIVMIEDCGLTEFHGVPTKTCIGIGPFYSDEIDKFTQYLKLL